MSQPLVTLEQGAEALGVSAAEFRQAAGRLRVRFVSSGGQSAVQSADLARIREFLEAEAEKLAEAPAAEPEAEEPEVPQLVFPVQPWMLARGDQNGGGQAGSQGEGAPSWTPEEPASGALTLADAPSGVSGGGIGLLSELNAEFSGDAHPVIRAEDEEPVELVNPELVSPELVSDADAEPTAVADAGPDAGEGDAGSGVTADTGTASGRMEPVASAADEGEYHGDVIPPSGDYSGFVDYPEDAADNGGNNADDADTGLSGNPDSGNGPTLASGRPPVPAPTEQSVRVLLVEPDQGLAAAEAAALSESGFAADTTAGRAGMLTQLKQKTFGLVLIDHRPEDGEGLRLLAEVRRLRPGQPAALMTADAETGRALRSEGAADCLIKDDGFPRSLGGQVRGMLNGSHAGDASGSKSSRGESSRGESSGADSSNGESNGESGGESNGADLVELDPLPEPAELTELPEIVPDPSGYENPTADLFANSPIGLFRLDAGGAVVKANRRLAELIGWDNPAGLVGASLVGRLAADRNDGSRLLAAAAEPGGAHGRLLSLRGGDGRPVPMTIHLRADLDSAGNVLSYDGAALPATAALPAVPVAAAVPAPPPAPAPAPAPAWSAELEALTAQFQKLRSGLDEALASLTRLHPGAPVAIPAAAPVAPAAAAAVVVPVVQAAPIAPAPVVVAAKPAAPPKPAAPVPAKPAAKAPAPAAPAPAPTAAAPAKPKPAAGTTSKRSAPVRTGSTASAPIVAAAPVIEAEPAEPSEGESTSTMPAAKRPKSAASAPAQAPAPVPAKRVIAATVTPVAPAMPAQILASPAAAKPPADGGVQMTSSGPVPDFGGQVQMSSSGFFDMANVAASGDSRAPNRGDNEVLDLNALTRQAVWFAEPKIKANGRPVEISQKLGFCAPVRGNRARLREVIARLLLNAADLMPGGGKIAISSGTVPKGVFVAVSNTGAGIAADIKRRLFDEDFVPTEDWQHVLRECLEIMLKHHGKIGLISEPGKGCTVTIRVPAAIIDDEPTMEMRT